MKYNYSQTILWSLKNNFTLFFITNGRNDIIRDNKAKNIYNAIFVYGKGSTKIP